MNDGSTDGGLTRAIAVIGMAGRFPEAANLEEFWSNLRDGVECVTFFSDQELLAAGVPPEVIQDPHYVKAGSLLKGVELFDAPFFGYSAREAEILDPQQRVFLELCWEALENAGYTPDNYQGLMGVYAGVAWNTYLLSNLTPHLELFERGGGFQVFVANDKDFMPTRVSYKLNLKGPSVIIQTSCSTSLVAVHLACLSLLNFECDMALVGGVTVKVPQVEGYFYQEGGLASPDGHCRAFDAKAAGTIFGSGAGVVVLKRLTEAQADGDRIRAVIRGSAINNDGSAKVSYTAPSVEGQAEVIAAALAMAGVDPETIGYVETHGTGTSLGDPIEVAALIKVFRQGTEKKGFCALGSVKTNIGHLDAAAGIAGFIKTVLALEHRQLPPSLNFQEPNPEIDFESSPFYVNAGLKEWEGNGLPRRAGVSSFGVGGTNAHVILEEAPPREPSGASRPCQLLVLSARTESALEAATDRLISFLRESPDLSLPDVAYTLAVGRTVFRHRRMVVCGDRDEAVEALASRDAARVWTAEDMEDPRERPVVFLFPGQGAQYLNMARGLYEGEAVFRRGVDRCAEGLRPHLGLDLREILYPSGDEGEEAEERLRETRLAQPALFVVEYALAQLWMEWGIQPQAMIGHSIGEYVAACLAGVFSLEDALGLVAVRGRLMQEQPPGAMAAVPLAAEEIQGLLPPEVSVAAINEPGRCVVSGPVPAVEGLEEELARRGVQVRRLKTSHAFHSPMMEPALRPFAAAVEKVPLGPPQLPYISNLTGTWIRAEEATDPGYWVRHLRQPVQFALGVKELLTDPQRVFLEVGPGRTLATLVGRHPARGEHLVVTSVPHPQDKEPDHPVLLRALGRLWLAGVKMDWRGFYAGERRHRLSLPTYPFERQRYWIEPGERTRRTGAPAGVRKRPDIAHWFYLPSWKPSLSPAPDPSAKPLHSWLLFLDRHGLGRGLAARLRERGRQVVEVEVGEGFSKLGAGRFTLRPDNREDYLALLGELEGGNRLPEVIVHAWTLTAEAPEVANDEAFETSQKLGFYSLLALAQALTLRVSHPLQWTLVTNQLEAISEEDPLRPEKAPLLGFCRILPQEHPGMSCRCVDVHWPESDERGQDVVVNQLLAEAEGRRRDELVLFRGHERWVPAFEPVRLEAVSDGESPFRSHGVYLVTGGLEGNGFALARYLARTVAPRLVLLEEPSFPLQGEWAKHLEMAAQGDPILLRIRRAQELQELGAEILVVTADLGNEGEMEEALSCAERHFGPLNGLIHAAGPVGERTFRVLQETGPQECRWHFRPRVHALYVLDRVLATRRDLDFCVLLSSLASVLGGVAYGAYTAAHLFMDSFARQRNRRREPRWLSLNWDLWELEGEREQITQIREDLADLAMTSGEGEEAFLRAVKWGRCSQLLVSTADLAARLEGGRERIAARRSRRPSAAAGGEARGLYPRPPLQTPYVPPETELEGKVVVVWEEILGCGPIGVQDNFFELGGDSFVAIQVASRLKEELEMDFPVAKLYQGLTPRTLAQVLAQDETREVERLAAELEERRKAMSRRREFEQMRRSRRGGARG